MSPSKSIALILLLIAAGISLLFFPLRQWFSDFEAYVHALGAVGPVVYALAYVALTVFLFPASLVTVGAGTLFGLQTGLVVVLIGANLGALCSFLLARTFLRQRVTHWTESNPKFRFLDEAIGRQGFKMVLLCRLSPIFPFILLNYFLGLTAVRIVAYVLANLLGMLPAMFLLVYIGATARDALEAQPAAADFYQQLLKYIGLAATVVIVVAVTRMARRALRQAEQAQEDSLGAAQPGMDENYEPTPFDRMVSVEDPHDQRLLENCRPAGWINPTPAKKYNLVVIGGGTAGLVSAAGAAGLGAKVALIERNLLGGDCLNVGCVPSKAMLRAARAAHEIRNGEFGVTLPGGAEANFSTVMERMRRLRAGISDHDSVERFAGLGVDVFIGQGRFVEWSAIEVDGRQLRFDRAVIATGARAAVPRIAGLREAGFYTNETIFNLTERPRRLAVIGAGPLGCELAQCFVRLGSAVILITDGARILPREDADAADVVCRQMEKDGVRIVTGATVQRAEIKNDSKALALLAGDCSSEVLCDAILVAVGRAPNLENLGLEAAGIRYSVNGIEVNERLRTTNRRVFAAGDVCSRFKFTHAADAMARIVIANALFLARRKVTDLVMPWCTYTDPEIAHVGSYEKAARAAGFDAATFTQEMSGVDRAILDGETEGFARVHYDKKSGRILGGTIVARHAGEMVGELTLAMVAGQKLDALSLTIHSYPTQAEALRKIGDAYMKTKLTPTVKKLFARWLAWRR
jgi:pyruvate/2-oxoglutarate dehydrogenase complex dihydrolipoamide dehydrogenase (E3) component/uncharacterized membrane protein YdjX (TVP38/TMEM64 family)